MTYEGWTNYETWNINLWLDNEEPLHRTKIEWVKNTLATAPPQEHELLVRHFIFDTFPSGTPDMDHPSDLAKVNFQELVEDWLQEIKEHD